jgi:carboxymethylenebutenolidase
MEWFSRSRRLVLVACLAAGLIVAGCVPVQHFKASNPPNNAQDPDFSWFVAPAAQPGKQVLIGLTRAGPPDPARPALLLIHGYDGLNRDYMSLAREFRTAGFDVAIGCWQYNGAPINDFDPLIQCPLGPTPPGVSGPAVAEVDQLVSATHNALGNTSQPLTVIGFSAGGGVAALRNSMGRTEPIVAIAGLLQGTTAWGPDPGGTDVTTMAATFAAPTLLIHGDADTLVPVAQAHAMEAALQAAGKVVASKYYAGAGHGLLGDPATRADVVLTIATWALDPLVPLASSTGVSATSLDPDIVEAVQREAARHGVLDFGNL